MENKTVSGTSLDPTIQFAELIIDEVPYKVAYSFNSIAIAEKLTNTNLLTGLVCILGAGGLNAEQLLGLFFAALLVAQPTMTLEQAGSLIRPDTMPAVIEAIGKAYNLSVVPEKKSDQTNNTQVAA